MQSITLIIALLGSIAVVALRPPKALAFFVALLVFYPTYLVLSLGTMDVSAGRVVGTVLLVRCLVSKKTRAGFEWCRLDTWVTAYVVSGILIMAVTRHSIMLVLENRAGYTIDTWCAYMAVRLCCRDRSTFVSFVKWVGIVLAFLAVSGVLEMVQHRSLYSGLEQYCPWLVKERVTDMRYGLARAKGAFGHAIMFGVSFALFLPAVCALRNQRDHWKILGYILASAVGIGALSSMSSAPWVAVILVVLCLALERCRHLVKPLLISFVVGCLFIAIVSNRPFYHVIVSYANPLGGAGWHRAKIIDCAKRDFGKWWLAGYRGADPGWGRDLGMGHTDVTNEYVLVGVRYGILGVITFVGIQVAACRKLIALYGCAEDCATRSWVWALGSAQFAMAVTFMGVSMFSQTVTLFFCSLGMVGSLSNLVLRDGTRYNCFRGLRNTE